MFSGFWVSSYHGPDLHNNSARASAPAGRMGSPMTATAQLPWAVMPLRFPEIKYNPKVNPKRNPWRMKSAPVQQPTGGTRRQGAPFVHLGRIRAVEATAADFRAFTESPDHQIVVLRQRESLTSVALYSAGSRRYAAKLESCGVDLQLCFDGKPSSLAYSVLGGPPHEAPGSVFFCTAPRSPIFESPLCGSWASGLGSYWPILPIFWVLCPACHVAAMGCPPMTQARFLSLSARLSASGHCDRTAHSDCALPFRRLLWCTEATCLPMALAFEAVPSRLYFSRWPFFTSQPLATERLAAGKWQATHATQTATARARTLLLLAERSVANGRTAVL